MKWSGKYYWLTAIAYALLSIGTTGIFLFSGGSVSSTTPMILSMVISALGNGIGVTTTLIALSEYSPPAQIYNLADGIFQFQTQHLRTKQW